MKVQLYVYFQITTANYSPVVAHTLIGIGAAIVVVGMLGCCCTVKGNSVLLYFVSIAEILLDDMYLNIYQFIGRHHFMVCMVYMRLNLHIAVRVSASCS